ncbi:MULTISPECIES: NUDIX hydrolase [Bacillus]|uniref:NUDIX domain-containing protein n=2 Tax=Bacillus cereus group TaxID=86661 RepID=A0A2B0XWN7_BACAN|nr:MULTISPECIES: NUDIX hydrolase [Bacillus]KZD26094.1 mutT/nudix family protein [Bacillus cereus]MBJ8058970.1 NUDIX hydrolase [Bacillus cereus]MCU4757090.1 NUDIX hydrolase [Bacillus cereus]MCU5106919.1 NUDIX hydrolase [Bacillus cereus]MCU5339747.1 NUDIX hydrolase [Bacillus cereus]
MISKFKFGSKKPTVHYVLRPSCYAIIFNSSSKIAVIQKGDRYFLPGGCMEGNETKEECLHRELLEELGWAIEIDQYIGNAMRYFYAEKEDTYYLNDGFFYIANMAQKQTKACEEDHVLRWMSPLHAVGILIHDHQKWAVEQALFLQKQKGSPSM